VIVRWADVDFVDNPGTYWCRGARLPIEPEHIAAWKQDSETPFCGTPQERSHALVYVLTPFETGAGAEIPNED